MNGGRAAYRVSKGALNPSTKTLAWDEEDIKVNSMCPGWVRTDMGGSGATKSVEDGADTAVWLATLPDDGPTGGFFRDRRPIPRKAQPTTSCASLHFLAADAFFALLVALLPFPPALGTGTGSIPARLTVAIGGSEPVISWSKLRVARSVLAKPEGVKVTETVQDALPDAGSEARSYSSPGTTRRRSHLHGGRVCGRWQGRHP